MGLQLHGTLTRVRPATVENAELLVAWHADPEVARYWDGETFTREQMVSRLSRRDVDSFIVEAADEPVGYIQAWWEEGSPDQGGIDMFLVPKARGHGARPGRGARSREPPPR